jgi:hypothetical protein
LDETAGNNSYLSMTVTGLDDTQLGEVTASLGGTNSSCFVEPPQVSGITESSGEFTVVLTLTGTVVPNGGGNSAIKRGQAPSAPLVDAELTVTILQGALRSDPMPVLAIYINPNENVMVAG